MGRKKKFKVAFPSFMPHSEPIKFILWIAIISGAVFSLGMVLIFLIWYISRGAL